jgi:hypothetical protein
MLRDLADLCESVMVDERVAGVLASQTYGLIGRDMHITGDPIQAIALEGLEGRPGDFPRMCPEGELERLIAWGRIMGIGYARKEYPPFRAIGEREIPYIRTWHPRYLRYEHPRPGLTYGRMWAMTATGEVEVKPENGWVVYTPYGKQRPWAFALWRALSFAWIIKQLAILDRARYSEVSGQPVRVGIAPQGATERARKRWQAALQALSADSAMVLPEGYDFKLVEATSTNYEVFQQAIDWADKAITIAIKGEQVTTEGSSGFSNGDNQADVSNAILAFVEKSISTCLNEQLIAEWSRFNFVGNKRCYLGWEVSPAEDEKKRAEGIDALGKAIVSVDGALKKSGFRADAKKLADDFHIPVVALTEEEKKAPDPNQKPPPGPMRPSDKEATMFQGAA